jgi:hypothetical protein
MIVHIRSNGAENTLVRRNIARPLSSIVDVESASAKKPEAPLNRHKLNILLHNFVICRPLVRRTMRNT